LHSVLLRSAALLASPSGGRVFKGAGVRLPHGVSPSADDAAKDAAKATSMGWGIEYEGQNDVPTTGTAVHALELAHAAKFNLGTQWGIGESGIAGPGPHHRTSLPSGMGFVAVAGPTPETTGVLKLNASDQTRSENMVRFANGALDLMGHLQSKAT
jgi:hypothetical protein